jgi:LPS-assembly lipoprotein
MKRRLALATICTAALSACGFKLRGSVNLPFNALFSGLPENSLLAAELHRAIEGAGAKVITESIKLNAAQVILDSLQDLREKVVLGQNVSGQVKEFQLRVRYRFRLRDQQGRELIPETELLLQREISYSEATALAKESEEAGLYRNMQSDIVQQVLRRLAAVKF